MPIPIHVVLLSHNGFSFDFPVLLAEVERRPQQLNVSTFLAHHIHFGDTLPSSEGTYSQPPRQSLVMIYTRINTKVEVTL